MREAAMSDPLNDLLRGHASVGEEDLRSRLRPAHRETLQPRPGLPWLPPRSTQTLSLLQQPSVAR